MNNQEIFDKVAKHLLTQNERSVMTSLNLDGSSLTSCVYRSSKGLKCAIGCLIPDTKYNRNMESKSVNASIVAVAVGLKGNQIGFAKRLQTIHDEYFPPSWKDLLIELAQEYDLDFKVCSI